MAAGWEKIQVHLLGEADFCAGNVLAQGFYEGRFRPNEAVCANPVDLFQ